MQPSLNLSLDVPNFKTEHHHHHHIPPTNTSQGQNPKRPFMSIFINQKLMLKVTLWTKAPSMKDIARLFQPRQVELKALFRRKSKDKNFQRSIQMSRISWKVSKITKSLLLWLSDWELLTRLGLNNLIWSVIGPTRPTLNYPLDLIIISPSGKITLKRAADRINSLKLIAIIITQK